VSGGRNLRVGIAGGRGYGGAESLRWLLAHPLFEVSGVTSRRHAGERVDTVHPHLAGFYRDLTFTQKPEDLLADDPDAIILALPHKHSAEHAKRLLDAKPDLRVVDLSGDHRLGDAASYGEAYGVEHPHPEELTGGGWVYGVPEVNREALRTATRIANPGCFATGAVLAALPLARRGLIGGAVRHVAISGSSGSGADPKAGTHHPERMTDVKAYKVLGHQHVPEIRRCLTAAGMPADAAWQMVPQSGPFARGIFTTLFVDLTEEMTTEALQDLYRSEYGLEPFVRLRDGTPRVAHVAGTNFCDIAVHAEGRTAVVLSAIDNLGKGMASQAVQNLNLAFDLMEGMGLRRPGGRP
jgi:[amino group carrier protein]-6-phospho-L-2-aminoadipate/5-phospho-L-glutamate reductase